MVVKINAVNTTNNRKYRVLVAYGMAYEYR